MKTFATAAALAVGATAVVLPRNDGCCFSLTASGGVSGTASQLSDGQIRFGSNAPDGTSQFCLNNGGLTDGSGRDCVISSPTTQIQCDAGAKTPAGGFSVGSDCTLAHNGDETFYACPSGSGYNLYLQPVDNQPKCVKISLSTSGKCCAAKSTSSSMMSSTCPAPSTVYKTSTASAPAVTVTNVQTKYETAYKTQPASTITLTSTQVNEQTEYETKTEEVTEYNTKTVEETETNYKTQPASTITAYETTTAMSSCPAPSTYWKTTTQQMTTTEQMSCPAPSTYWKTSMMTSMMIETVSDCSSVVMTQTKPVWTSSAMMTTPAASSPAKTTAPASGTTTGSACQTQLTGAYQTPHLIVPVCSEKPDEAYGTSYFGSVNSTFDSVFNFDIPASYAGKTCSVIFMFPEKSQLETSSYDFNGQGSMSCKHLSSAANMRTTWNNCPKPDTDMGSVGMQPGNTYVISSGPCAAGTTQSYELSPEGGMDLYFFQDWNPSPLGMYITAC